MRRRANISVSWPRDINGASRPRPPEGGLRPHLLLPPEWRAACRRPLQLVRAPPRPGASSDTPPCANGTLSFAGLPLNPLPPIPPSRPPPSLCAWCAPHSAPVPSEIQRQRDVVPLAALQPHRRRACGGAPPVPAPPPRAAHLSEAQHIARAGPALPAPPVRALRPGRLPQRATVAPPLTACAATAPARRVHHGELQAAAGT